MKCNLNVIYALVGGAIIGAGAALLLAPEKGADLRCRIKKMLKERGMCCCDKNVEEIVEELTEKDA
ncbi:MAG: YtxH domain-containing protein [Muribaculaceae bacterium]|nr:YtxH domain-containing protein [Muribaculaceae bacterium]MBR1963982.1 YtxH domain-containing protein [Muribaculaceae bacterium]